MNKENNEAAEKRRKRRDVLLRKGNTFSRAKVKEMEQPVNQTPSVTMAMPLTNAPTTPLCNITNLLGQSKNKINPQLTTPPVTISNDKTQPTTGKKDRLKNKRLNAFPGVGMNLIHKFQKTTSWNIAQPQWFHIGETSAATTEETCHGNMDISSEEEEEEELEKDNNIFHGMVSLLKMLSPNV